MGRLAGEIQRVDVVGPPSEMQVLCSEGGQVLLVGGRECCVNNINLSTGICRPHLSDLGKLVENAGFLALPHNQLLTILDPRRIIYNHSSWATLMYLRVTVIFFRRQ